MSSPTVAIIGSGLTGLLIAQGLRRNGIPSTVFEQDPSIDHRRRDWSLLLHWSLACLDSILPEEVIKELPRAYCDRFYSEEEPPPLPCFDSADGNPLFYIPSSRMRLVSRKRFRQVVCSGLDIQYNKQLAKIIQHEETSKSQVTLVFQDGTVHNADIVIGADGPNSIVRKMLLGEAAAAAQQTPWSISIATFQVDDAEKAVFLRVPHPVWHMEHGHHGISAIAALDVTDAQDPSKTTFTFVKLWHSETKPEHQSIKRDEALSLFKAHSQHSCEPYRSGGAWIPEHSQCNVDELKYWAPSPWDNRGGRVTLAGDAAHALLPFRAQGLNVSLEDVQNLVRALVRISNGAPRKQVLDGYDADVCRRGRESVLASLEEGKRKMNVERLMTSETAMRGFAKEAAKEAPADTAKL